MKKLNWNQFLQSCKLVWAEEYNSFTTKEDQVRWALQNCDKSPRQTLIQVAAAAFKLYKSTQF